MRILLVMLLTVGLDASADCTKTISEAEVSKIVAEFRSTRPDIPRKKSEVEIELKKNLTSCHYIYSEFSKIKKIHGDITFILNPFGEVVDVRSNKLLLPTMLKCPKMELEKQYFKKKIMQLRDNKIDLIVNENSYSRSKLSTLRCMYVYQEYDPENRNPVSGNIFYFDFRGDLIYAYSSKNR